MVRLGATLLFPALALASSVLDLNPSNFDATILESGVPSLVEFFAPWCGHCKSLAPVYEQLADGFASSKKVNIAKVDADEHKSLGSKFGVSGFPTLKWFDGKSKEPTDYQGGRDLESLSAFVTEKTGIKLKKKAALPSAVEMLTDKTFKEQVGGDKDVLVAFTAPWCGHCKTLAPTWETLAHDFSTEPTVLIAKVDAEAADSKATAQDQGVKSYPTIKFFPKGSTTPVDYSGGRDEKSLIEYLNEQSGTHRVVGGGLDAKAGTIAALDAIIGTLTSSNLEEVTAELAKASEGLKDTYAAYYAKVLTKMAASKTYVEKELARLEGMMKKTGLVKTKQDDLASRINILKMFKADSEKEEL